MKKAEEFGKFLGSGHFDFPSNRRQHSSRSVIWNRVYPQTHPRPPLTFNFLLPLSFFLSCTITKFVSNHFQPLTFQPPGGEPTRGRTKGQTVEKKRENPAGVFHFPGIFLKGKDPVPFPKPENLLLNCFFFHSSSSPLLSITCESDVYFAWVSRVCARKKFVCVRERVF